MQKKQGSEWILPAIQDFPSSHACWLSGFQYDTYFHVGQSSSAFKAFSWRSQTPRLHSQYLARFPTEHDYFPKALVGDQVNYVNDRVGRDAHSVYQGLKDLHTSLRAPLLDLPHTANKKNRAPTRCAGVGARSASSVQSSDTLKRVIGPRLPSNALDFKNPALFWCTELRQMLPAPTKQRKSERKKGNKHTKAHDWFRFRRSPACPESLYVSERSYSSIALVASSHAKHSA